MLPTDSKAQATNFYVFKRRNKDPKTNTKSDDQIINIQEESSEEKESQDQATIVLTGLPVTPFSNVQDITQSPASSTSQMGTQ